MAGLAIKDSWRLLGTKLISSVPWSYNGSESNHSKRSSAYKEKWPQGSKMDSLPVCLAGLRQLTAGGGMLWLPPPPTPGTLKTRTAACCSSAPWDSPSLPITAPKRLKSPKNTPIVTSQQKPLVCVFSCGVRRWSRRPSEEKTHLRSPTHSSVRYRLPTEVLCFDREGERRGRRGGGGQVFFQAVENGGEFYDPCSLSSCKNHTRRFSSVAASSAAQPMKTMERVEKKQGKQRGGKKKELLGRKYLQVYFIHIHHPFPSHQALRWTPLPTHTHVEIFKTLRSSHGFSVAIRAGDLPKLSAGTLFCGGGSFGSSPTKMHHGADPPHVGG